MNGDTLTVRCACGWETSGTEAEVTTTTIDHGRRLHNMEATPEQVLAMAAPSDDIPADPPAAASPSSTPAA